MSGNLTLTKGMPNWYLSNDIWVQHVGTPNSGPPGIRPAPGQAYDVWVRVHNMDPDPSGGKWNLFVEWAIPGIGNIPVIQANFLNGVVSGGVANGLALTTSVPKNSIYDVKCATPWVPVFENGGHECLIAVVYNGDIIKTGGVPGVDHPGPPGSLGSLNGNAESPSDGSWSIAQKNLGLLTATGPGFRYAFRAGRVAGTEDGFIVVAHEAPLSGIAAFLGSVPGGETVLQNPGKVEHLGIVPSTTPSPREIEAAQPRLGAIKIPSCGHSEFTLVGSVREGNVLINVTQELHGRAVGGLSVLVLGHTK